MTEKSDAELVDLARTGDKHAFGILIERYQRISIRVALRMVANEEIARELVQDALLQAYLSLNHLREGARFKSWLYGIVLNVCRNYVRNQEIEFFSLEALPGGMRLAVTQFTLFPDPQEMAEERELHQLVLDAVSELSSKDRDTTLLFYYEELSIYEIAAILGISVAAVKSRLHKARKKLAGRLLPHYREMSRTLDVKQRREKMVQVTIADVIKGKGAELEGRPSPMRIVVLHDQANHRALPIWVGPFEGDSIALGILQPPVLRPMTYNFIAKVLEAVGVKLEEVRIQTLKDDTYYAVAKLRRGEAVQEVDARPSDAIALAQRTGAPIWVADEIMEKAGLDIAQMAGKTPTGEIEFVSVLKELQEKPQRFPGFPLSPPPPQAQTQVTPKNQNQEIIAFVFGSKT